MGSRPQANTRILAVPTLGLLVLVGLMVGRPQSMSGGTPVRGVPCTNVCDICGYENGRFLYDATLVTPFLPNDFVYHSACDMVNCWGSFCSGDFLSFAPNDLPTHTDGLLAAASPLVLELAFYAFPDVISYNEDRKAMQVKGCQGEFVAHIPFDRPMGQVATRTE